MRHLLIAALAAPLFAFAAPPEARVIVAFKPEATVLRGEARPLAAEPAGQASARLQRRADALAAHAGRPLVAGRPVGSRWQVLRARGLSSEALAARLASHPDVAWVQPDRRKRALMVPNDPLYPAGSRPLGPDAGQWYLRAPDATFRSAVDAEAAWDRLPDAGAGVVIAVIDTGVRPEHPDLAGRLLPGIDTIDDLDTANDGNGPDADASDPGDWVTSAESRSGPLAGCSAGNSSWHGTQVSTIAGALTNDANGMAGTAFGVRILPVRVLGKCGGYDSDIVAGMLWAAGLEPVAGIVNANPAQVLNMSLGGAGTCEPAYVAAMERITAAGKVVVAAAGNDTGRAVGSPANCPGVIGVGGLRHAGTKVGFSDLGPEIAISAPGGNCVNIDPGEACLYPILAGADSGTQGPAGPKWTDSYDYSVGTSFSSPIVAGTVAMVMANRPALTPAEVRRVLQSSARPFPTSGADNGPDDPTPVPACRAPGSFDQLQCYCTTALCGAGMLDAIGALGLSDGLFARIDAEVAQVPVGKLTSLSAARSIASAGANISRYSWTILSGPAQIASQSTEAAIELVPTGVGTVLVELVVSDSVGASSSARLSLTALAGPTAMISLQTSAPKALAPVVLSSSASTAPSGRSIRSRDWQVVDASGVGVPIDGSSSGSTVQFTPSVSGTYSVSLTVTDTLGGVNAAQFAVVVAAADPTTPPSPPANPPSTSGGGAVGLGWLLLLAISTAILQTTRATGRA